MKLSKDSKKDKKRLVLNILQIIALAISKFLLVYILFSFFPDAKIDFIKYILFLPIPIILYMVLHKGKDKSIFVKLKGMYFSCPNKMFKKVCKKIKPIESPEELKNYTGNVLINGVSFIEETEIIFNTKKIIKIKGFFRNKKIIMQFKLKSKEKTLYSWKETKLNSEENNKQFCLEGKIKNNTFYVEEVKKYLTKKDYEEGT
jgi:hypothetical protein